MGHKIPTLVRDGNVHGLSDLRRPLLSSGNDPTCIIQRNHVLASFRISCDT